MQKNLANFRITNSPFYHVLNTVVVNNTMSSTAAITASNITVPSDDCLHHLNTNAISRLPDDMYKHTKENQPDVKQIDENSSLPDNLKMIINKAWEACNDENIENIPPQMKRISDDTPNIIPKTITTAANTPIVCTCQPNEVILTATQVPSPFTTSPDSGLGYEHMIHRDRRVLHDAVRQPFTWSQSQQQPQHHQTHQTCIQGPVVIPKPRPLVRQKENIDPNLFFYPPTSSSGKSVKGTGDSNKIHYQVIPRISQQMTSSTIISTSTATMNKSISNANNNNNIKSVQMPMRHPFKRRQDAIYNARYKTQPCVHYQKHKHCPLGENCHFAHGPEDLKHPEFHPKYRTQNCYNYARTGDCPYGEKCFFVHPDDELLTASSFYHHQLENSGNHNSVNTINPWNGESFTGQAIMSNINNTGNDNSTFIDSVLLYSYLRQVAI
ncbi:unnamed protein product [Trichobilharzia regenti]|uniref:C3H1-type domain-containing protein n=1 Tax=Trichobilharzia regenti TaxID=157069 RepID=A0A183W869_TRIRE|nr:unnamed protein product [Trichobilharzia regenti]VDQ04202.1 unnamed protein product [Trichobilharzia regenti]